MKIITISREFGSGGRELGKRLAEQLGYDYYDREIIASIAHGKNLDESYVEHKLNQTMWQSVPLTFRRSFTTPGVMTNAQVQLLLEQKLVIEEIAKAGRDCVIVGRNADAILAKENPFCIFVCANMEAKIRRCMDRAEAGENLTSKEMERNIQRIDRNRAKTRELITGEQWGDPKSYHLTVNTSGWEIKDLTPAVAAFIDRWYGRNK